jgi:hypothetical protein
MNTAQTQMQVYAVIGGFDYEGESFESLRLFDCRSTAEAYRQQLEDDGYDYVMMVVREIEMQSAILPSN